MGLVITRPNDYNNPHSRQNKSRIYSDKCLI